MDDSAAKEEEMIVDIEQLVGVDLADTPNI